MSTLDAKENELYRLLARYYVAAHMEDCKEHHMTMTIEVAYSLFDKPKQIFSAKGKKTLEPGWKSLLKDEGEEPELPQVNAGEAGRAVDARVLDRKTEPPRRMSLGGLPEVMARLIELVTDPRQKKALENPVNPKEPKGLGTVASRKEGKGKDPLIEVTPLGLEVWKRLNKVYPDHASPVARAVFESHLALIGKMNRVDAEKAFQHAQKRTREQVGRMVEAIKNHKEPFDVTLWQGTKPQSKPKGKKLFKSKRKKVA
jgi:DNA topoisomerase-3